MKKSKNKYAFPWLGINHENRFEIVEGDSLTVPDEAYTIPELVRKSMAGISPDINLMSNYDDAEVNHDDIDISAFSHADLVDKHEAAKRAVEVSKIVSERRSKKSKGNLSEKTDEPLEEEKGSDDYIKE